MNQELLGTRNFFHGTVVKNWKGNEINESIDFKHNKLIIKESVSFYHKCWINRCEILHDDDEQKKRLSKWCKNALKK